MFSKNVLINKKSLAKNSLGTNKLIRGTTHIPANICLKQTITGSQRLNASTRSLLLKIFTKTASVGNSKYYLNLRKLSAADFLSLQENNTLLDTFIAFLQYKIAFTLYCILDTGLKNVNRFRCFSSVFSPFSDVFSPALS